MWYAILGGIWAAGAVYEMIAAPTKRPVTISEALKWPGLER